PDFRRLLLDHLPSAANRVNETEFLQPANDKRLEKNERHLLRQTALVQLQFRTDHDHGTAGVVDAFSEQVLTEPALFSLQHIAEGFQRTISGASHRTTMTSVVE